MKLLAIETSTTTASVAVSFRDETYQVENHELKQHAVCILSMIDQVLAHAGLRQNQLDGIVFGRGPGSFTGLRIACSVAQALAYALDLPIYPVSNLLAIGYPVFLEQNNLPVLAVIDARMQQYYCAYFSALSDFTSSHSPQEQVLSAQEIAIPAKTPFILAGVGIDALINCMAGDVSALIHRHQSLFSQAATLIKLVQHGVCQAVAIEMALPIYVRDQAVALKGRYKK